MGVGVTVRMQMRSMFVFLAIVLGFPMNMSVAKDIPAAKGEIVLTVSGSIRGHNREGDAVFDMDMLKTMRPVTYKTSTPWSKGLVTYVGVLLRDVLAYVDAKGKMTHVYAINDYDIDIPVSDAVTGGPILAYEMNGAPMTVRDKGPLWIIYPYDSKREYQSDEIYARSVWQLARIVVNE